MFSINQRNAHVPLRSSLDASTAAKVFADPAARQQTRVMTLNGIDWAFKLYDKPEAVPEAFASPDFDAAKWSRVCKRPIALVVSARDWFQFTTF